MSKKSLIIILTLIVAIGGGFLLWRVEDTRAKAAKLESAILNELSDDDIQLIVANQAVMDPAKALSIVNSEESRKAFLKGLGEYLALASRARRDGLTDDPNFKLVLQNKEKGLLTDLYLTKAEVDGKVIDKITDEQIQAVWANPDNEKEFKAEIDAGAAVQKDTAEKTENPLGISPPLQGGALEKFRRGWARAKIISDIAKADGDFMQQRSTQVRLKILESGVLSNSCLSKYWKEKIKATDQEISAYLATHPEYDLNKKREKAEMILARIKAGEDFATLAKEFSEHRSTKEGGGLYDESVEGPLEPEVKKMALALQPGQLADKVIETKSGYAIIQLVLGDTKNDTGKEVVPIKVRRILFQKLFEDPDIRNPNIPAPFVPAADIAKAAVQKEKRDRFVAEIVQSEHISIPEDFQFEPTEAMKRIKADQDRISELVENDRKKIKLEEKKRVAK
jgi:hypothetical protein